LGGGEETVGPVEAVGLRATISRRTWSVDSMRSNTSGNRSRSSAIGVGIDGTYGRLGVKPSVSGGGGFSGMSRKR
jgi:hypothetical protein